MTSIAIAMVKDEMDIVEHTIINMVAQVDHVIVADNGSTDGTRDILDRLPITVVDDPDPAYRQSAKMTALAGRARQMGADWIVPFDADEWMYSPFGRIADVLADVAAQWLVVPAALYDHVATGCDKAIENPVRRIVWRRDTPAPLPKVACRWREDMVIGQGNHGATYNGGPTTFDQLLVIRHFPYRSVEQFVRKVRNGAAAYAAMTDVPPDVGTHWRQWGEILASSGEGALADVFRQWYWRADPEVQVRIDGERQPPLIFDPVYQL